MRTPVVSVSRACARVRNLLSGTDRLKPDLAAGVVWLLGVLEGVRQGAGTDVEQADLALGARRGIARGWLELGFEVLRQPQADGLLRIAQRPEVAAAGVHGVGELGGHLRAG